MKFPVEFPTGSFCGILRLTRLKPRGPPKVGAHTTFFLLALKRIKSYLRSTVKDEKLNHLALMQIESSVLRKLNFNNVLDQFVERLTEKNV